MSVGNGTFTPAELAGDHYRPIGGSYDTAAKAMEALEQHFRNTHGGRGTFQVFRPEAPGAAVALVEAASTDGDPMRIRALYKVLERRS
jgi:hypothetical protein